MDTIIIVLIVLVPVFLGLVGKALDKAGKDGAGAPPMPEAFPPVTPHMTEEGGRKLRKKQPKPAPQQPIDTSVYKAQQEEKACKKEKLDPKKLVIYSEIMKPKF